MDILATVPVTLSGRSGGVPVRMTLQAECIWSDGLLIIDAITSHQGPEPYTIYSSECNHLDTLGHIINVDILRECEHEAHRWYRFNT